MTNFGQMKTNLALDVRDELNVAFTTTMLGSFIVEGVAEVSRVYPKEALDDITPVAATYDYATLIVQAFRLEWYRSNTFYSSIPMNEHDQSAQAGWELWTNRLYLPKPIVDASVPATDYYRLWGYEERLRPVADGDIVDVDEQGEWAVRAYGRWRAYQAMSAERALFKQWQAISQNTDISPSQLQQSVLIYSGEWQSRRNQLRRLRRT
jgi:hypothetical protein